MSNSCLSPANFKYRPLLILALILIGACGGSDGDASYQPEPSVAKVHTEAAPPIYLTDLDRCQPQSSLSRDWKRGTWRLLDYTGERDFDGSTISQMHDAFELKPDPDRSFAGTLLVATDGNQAPEISYSPDRSGWYEIYVGLVRKPFEESKAVQVRLSRDEAFTTLSGREGEKDHQEGWLDEIYWKTADLTGQDIHLRQITYPRIRHAWVGFVKLVPLSESQVKELQADRGNPEHRRLFVHTDPGVPNEEGSREELLAHLEPLRHGDVARLYWETGFGDRVFYFSSIGRDQTRMGQLGDESSEPFYVREHGRVGVRTWQAYRRNGVDPLAVAVDFAHQHDIELHAAYRVGGFLFPAPHFADTRDSFFERHRDLVCLDREGNPLPRISYAFPETREYVLSLLREMASNYSIDGVALLYNRRPPLLAYEAPLVEGFQAKFGEDPRELDPSDERWLSFRAGFLTRFMRELRQMLDEVAREQGRSRLAVTAVVSRPGENLLHGMDLETWIREDLVDTLVPYSSSVRLNSFVPAWDDPKDVAHFVSLVEGTDCELAINLMPRDLSAQEYYRLAHSLYQSGVERFFFWDGLSRARKALRLGHREEVEEWFQQGQPSLFPTAVRLWSVDGWDLRVETPG